METTITKTVKGATMEAIFDNCELFSVRHFENLTLENDADFFPETKYKYKIKIRHAEDTDANVLFEEARFKHENLSPVNEVQQQINNVSVEMLLEALKPFAEMFGEFTSTKIRQGGTVFQYNDKHLTVSDFEKAEQVINYLSHHPIK